MFDYGNGSDGALNVASGITTLALDTKHQFTTVDVALVGQLKGVGNGSVLYITATQHIKINGTLTTFGIVDPGQNTWSATIDGELFNSPSAANGGKGGNAANGAVGGSQGNGFGGGGAGGALSGGLAGGNGGAGSATPSNGPTPASVGSNAGRAGVNGTNSAGGSGAAGTAAGGSATGGKGGNAYSGAGSDGSVSLDAWAGGGGGGGGQAGRPGVHIVLKAPLIEINKVVMTSGAVGGTGGNGATGATVGRSAGSNVRGSGGGGGGGGNAGNIYIYTENLVENAPIYTMAGGNGGNGGTGFQAGSAGSLGAPGQKIVYIDTGLIQGVAKVWNGTAWQLGVVKRRSKGQWLNSSVKYYEDI